MSRRLILPLVAAALAVAAGWALWARFEHSHRLSLAPAGLGITTILYASEKSFGLGPGGNETGLIVYALPAEAAAALARGGARHLSDAGGEDSPYRDWRATPVAMDERWRPDPESAAGGGTPPQGIAGFLFRYGWTIPLDPRITGRIDAALAADGGFYAYGRSSVALVAPGAGIAAVAWRK